MRNRHLRNYAWSLLAGLVMVAALWGAIVVVTAHNRAALRAEARVEAGNMARVFAEHIRRTVTMIDLALQDYRAYQRSNPGSPPAEGWRDAYLKEGGVFQWATIDERGMMAFSNLAPVTKPVDLSDREHFRVHRDSGRDELFISKPVLGRVSQRWSIQFTRRLSRPDGSFAGVVVLSVEPDYFIANFEAIDTGAHGVTLLAGMDRIVRARFSRQEADTRGLGEALPADYPFFDPARPVGAAPVTSFVDGVDRHSGWRQVKGYPLVVAAQVADDDVMERAVVVERNLHLVGALVTAVLLAGALAIGHLLERRARAQRLLERQADELRIANGEVERLAYVAAHDLQEPLRAITSYSQLVAMTYADALDDEGREWLGEVTAAAARMKHLLRDIQLYLAEKSLPLPTAPLAADAALKAALARLAPMVAETGAEIDAAPLPEVMADARRLTEAFCVLLANALQYRAPGRPPRIRIAARREGGFHALEVADNGIGIAPDYHERIFEVFQRLHSRADHPGTGMGLAIVRKMIQRLGGHIRVASTPGEGSTFTILLPDPALPPGHTTPSTRTTLTEARHDPADHAPEGREDVHRAAGGG
ncbi:sensor histidine kinase [Azospirillum sp.]|uniref:sensor histidine kinase n=1 Tax=Azospirillum sp. TaxID=34012 RepID=UPI002D53837A|nr:ATP-binding protein [Azospirillum sp.]HYD71196.1 ATP-binding protein [Azospirillum sp.]